MNTVAGDGTLQVLPFPEKSCGFEVNSVYNGLTSCVW
jgi:hypothetical protein